MRAKPAVSLLALALGATAFGAVAVGAPAIGRLAIGGLAVRKARCGVLEVDELTVQPADRQTSKPAAMMSKKSAD